MIADQISLGVCMATIPYVLWQLSAAVINRFTTWGSGPAPVALGSRIAEVRFHGIARGDCA